MRAYGAYACKTYALKHLEIDKKHCILNCTPKVKISGCSSSAVFFSAIFTNLRHAEFAIKTDGMIGTINQTFLSNGLALPFRKQFKMDKKAEKERL